MQIPNPEHCLPPLSSGSAVSFYPEEELSYPLALRLNQELFFLALRIGKLAQEVRAEATQRLFEGENVAVPEAVYSMNRRRRIQALHQVIENSTADWRSRYPACYSWLSRPDTTPVRVFRALEHVSHPMPLNILAYS